MQGKFWSACPAIAAHVSKVSFGIVGLLTGLVCARCQAVAWSSRSGGPPWSFSGTKESMFDKNDARIEQERAEAEEKRQRTRVSS